MTVKFNFRQQTTEILQKQEILLLRKKNKHIVLQNSPQKS